MAEANLLKTRQDVSRAMIDAGDRVVVVEFYATWCTPCQKMKPQLKAMEQEFQDVVFYKVNVDENGETTENYSVTAMPTFILFKNGSKIDRMQGADMTALKAMITKHLD